MKFAATRIVNSVIKVVNSKNSLPHFLVVLVDKDLISEVDVFSEDAPEVIRAATNWMAKQINIIIHQKKVELLDKKPGALYAGDPVIIFTRMIRRVDYYGDTINQHTYDL